MEARHYTDTHDYSKKRGSFTNIFDKHSKEINTTIYPQGLQPLKKYVLNMIDTEVTPTEKVMSIRLDVEKATSSIKLLERITNAYLDGCGCRVR